MIEELKEESGGVLIVTDRGNVSVIYDSNEKSDVKILYSIEACLKNYYNAKLRIKIVIKNEYGKENVKKIMENVTEYAGRYDDYLPIVNSDLIQKYRNGLIIGFKLDDIERNDEVMERLVEFVDFIEMPLTVREMYYGPKMKNKYREYINKIFNLCEENGGKLVNLGDFNISENNVVSKFLNENFDIKNQGTYINTSNTKENVYSDVDDKDILNKILIENPLKMIHNIT